LRVNQNEDDMTLATNAFTTYLAVGNREDLTEIITLVSPEETPFFTMLPRVKASGTLHEWQTQALEAATANAVLEGDDATTNAATASVRAGNYCQISDKVPRVTGTQEAVVSAGRDSEMGYQMSLKSAELKRDIELDLTSNVARNAGSGTAARKSAGLGAWVATNDSVGAGAGASPTGNGTNARTDGTVRAFTESLLTTVLQSIYTEGGDPDCIMAGAFNRRTFSQFTGGANKDHEVKDKTLFAVVDIYWSDWGMLKIIPNRFQRTRDVWVLEKDRWAMAILRPFHSVPLAKDGDSERRQIIVEYALECRAEQHNGLVADLTVA